MRISAVTLIGLLIFTVNCGDNDKADVIVINDNTSECGPNGTLHTGLGDVEPHCDCDSGFTAVEGRCVEDVPTAMPEAATTNDNNEGQNQGGETGDQDAVMMMPRPVPAFCWRPTGPVCDPRDASGCDTDLGETCDIAQTIDGSPNLTCLSGMNTQTLDAPCHPADGPFCESGLHCAPPGVCKRFCCDDAECDDGLKCIAFMPAAGSLGVCSDATPMNMCGSPGASCQSASDCCSRQCHVGHCH